MGGGHLQGPPYLPPPWASLPLPADLIPAPAIPAPAPRADEQNADITLWSSALVLLTLLINAPLIGPVMRWTGLSAVTAEKLRGRRAALAALRAHTHEVVEELKHDKGEFLQGERGCSGRSTYSAGMPHLPGGVGSLAGCQLAAHSHSPPPSSSRPGADWHAVEEFADHSEKLRRFALPREGAAAPAAEPTAADAAGAALDRMSVSALSKTSMDGDGGGRLEVPFLGRLR